MDRILERYERHSYVEMQNTSSHNESQGSWTLEHAKLKAKIELLQKMQRHLMGEELDSLGIKELISLEQQIDTALKHIRLKKNQLMLESISQLQKKDKDLKDHNNILSKQVMEKEKGVTHHESEQQTHEMMLPSFHLGVLTNYDTQNTRGNGEVEENPRQGQPSTVMPPWLIQHMNK